MSRRKMYIHVIEGHKVTRDEYNKLNEKEKTFYDKITSLRKAKASVCSESVEEDGDEF